MGGGVLLLAGVAFSTTGPSAVIALALNGVIALLTALSFAEMAARFPQSGGTYTFAKKALSVEAAFAVGWMVWFASIVAGALYALGFGEFARVLLTEAYRGCIGPPPEWLAGRNAGTGLAIGATTCFALSLIRSVRSGSQWINIAKVAVFAVLVLAGLWALPGRSSHDLQQSLTPFFAAGAVGLVQAMGFTFIALQGFDLIAAVGGEVRDPSRTIPRAMLLSLGTALAIYLPLLLVVATVGMAPGQSVLEASRANPETVVAVAAENYLGPWGYWLVLCAAVLSTLSALQANVFAASRIAYSMARDRTLPPFFGVVSKDRKIPFAAVIVVACIIVVIILFVPSVAEAGAAASLAFLITFALAHWIAVLVRRRSRGRPAQFRVPFFPLVPVVGGVSCLSLAVFQGITVPEAGLIAAAWLAAGGILFLGLLARSARVVDAASSAFDPEAARLRGHSPLVLVPIANPENAQALVAVANSLAPPSVGRVLLLSVVVGPEGWKPREDPRPLHAAQAVLSEAISASVDAGWFPEALATVSPQPWEEITRVAKIHDCESLLLGLSDISEDAPGTPLDRLINAVDSDIVVLRAHTGWQLSETHNILVPMGGRSSHDQLLARFLGSLLRTKDRTVTFLRVLGEHVTRKEHATAKRELRRAARNLSPGHSEVKTVLDDRAVDAVVEHAEHSDLVVLGVQRVRRHKLFGHFALEVARRTTCPIVVLSHRD